MRPLAPAVLIVLAWLPVTAQSPRPPAPAPKPITITGRVVNADGDPLRNARVSAGEVVVLTDGDGLFELTTAQTRLRITKAGYAPREPRVTPGQPLAVRLPRGAAISGRVLDSMGDPVAGISVAIRAAAETGGKGIPPAVTDDLGEYRIGSLAAGSYTLRASGITTRFFIVGPGMMLPAEMEGVSQPILLTESEERQADLTVAASANRTGYVTAAIQIPVPRGSATLHGRVSSRDGRPVAYAQVSLASLTPPRTSQPRSSFVTSPVARLPARTAAANREGVFEFRDIPAARYSITADRIGYSSLTGPVELTASDDAVTSADLVLDPDGAIAGMVADDAGEPLQDAVVQALRAEYRDGRKQLVPAGPIQRTNDRGEYRVYGLPPGDYVITAAIDPAGPASLPGFTRAYFPGTDEAMQSQSVTLDAARVLPGISFRLARARTVRIRGRIVNAAGEPTTGGQVRLMPSRRAGSFALIPASASISNDGHFEFGDVASGQYVIQADRGKLNPSTEGEFGALPVTVDDRDVSDLVLQMTAGTSVRGELVVRAANRATAPPPATFEIAAVAADPDDSPANTATAYARPDGRFEMRGLHGTRRIQVLQPPAGWIVEAVHVDGVDVTDTPVLFGGGGASIEVVVTDRAASVFGSVVDDRGRPVDGAHVIFYPTDRDQRYSGSRFFAHTSSQADGTFSVAAMPAGSYYAVAIANIPQQTNGWQDLRLLEALERQADPLTLRESGAVSLRLRLARP